MSVFPGKQFELIMTSKADVYKQEEVCELFVFLKALFSIPFICVAMDLCCDCSSHRLEPWTRGGPMLKYVMKYGMLCAGHELPQWKYIITQASHGLTVALLRNRSCHGLVLALQSP